MRTRINTVAWLLVLVILSACRQNQPVYRFISEPSLKPGDSVPSPSGKVILSVTGKIGITNVEGRLDFDMQTLERLGLVEYEVDDPFLKRVVTYRGPLLGNLLQVARISPNATELFATALNDYKTAIPLEVNKWPIIIATSRDGKPMLIEDEGPLEIVFPNKHFNIDTATYNQMWVWQLRTLVVR